MPDAPMPDPPEVRASGPDAEPARKGSGARRRRSLNDAIERQIDENLRRLYSEVAEEPIPEHLRQLLDKLKKRDGPQ